MTARGLALSLCMLAGCSSSDATTCPVPTLGDRLKSDLPAGSCRQGQSCPELVTREPCPTGLGPSVIYACSCQQGQWQCLETGRSKSACLPADDAGGPGPDAIADGRAIGGSPDDAADH